MIVQVIGGQGWPAGARSSALLTYDPLIYFGVSGGVELLGRLCTGPMACLVSQVRAVTA